MIYKIHLDDLKTVQVVWDTNFYPPTVWWFKYT